MALPISFGGKTNRWWDYRAIVNNGLSLEEFTTRYNPSKHNSHKHIEINWYATLKQINGLTAYSPNPRALTSAERMMWENHWESVAQLNRGYTQGIEKVAEDNNPGFFGRIINRAYKAVSHAAGYAAKTAISTAPHPVIKYAATGLASLVVFTSLGCNAAGRIGDAAGKIANPDTAKAEPALIPWAYLPHLINNSGAGAQPTPTPKLKKPLPREIAIQFAPIEFIDEYALAAVDEISALEIYWNVFIAHPEIISDILSKYVINGRLKPEGLNRIKDLDRDGRPNLDELANGTDPFNP